MEQPQTPFISQEPIADLAISSLGETALIDQIQRWLGPVAPPSPTGMGDDCAVQEVRPGKHQLFTTDSVTYGQHFDDKVRAHEAGAKLIKRNLSDIAAMGGQPGSALLNLLMGPDLSLAWLEAFVSGIRENCEKYEVLIVGGDMSRLARGHFTATLSLTGYTKGFPILRSTARIADAIYVTGTLGGSILEKHYNFEPRILEGQWLAARKEVTAMMDITDGLGKDLAALLPSESSASIQVERVPLSGAAQTCASQSKRSPEEHAFCDGEDYELLFCVAEQSDRQNFESAWCAKFPDLKLSQIGRIVKAAPAGRYINADTNQALPWQSGFEHF